MSRRFHSAALHVAIIAMLVRALLPAGWMPGPAGAEAFTICTMDASGNHADDSPSGKPSPADGQHSHEECPCAAAPQMAPPALEARLSAPTLTGSVADVPDHDRVSDRSHSYQPHSPRAPPQIA